VTKIEKLKQLALDYEADNDTERPAYLKVKSKIAELESSPQEVTEPTAKAKKSQPKSIMLKRSTKAGTLPISVDMPTGLPTLASLEKFETQEEKDAARSNIINDRNNLLQIVSKGGPELKSTIDSLRQAQKIEDENSGAKDRSGAFKYSDESVLARALGEKSRSPLSQAVSTGLKKAGNVVAYPSAFLGRGVAKSTGIMDWNDNTSTGEIVDAATQMRDEQNLQDMALGKYMKDPSLGEMWDAFKFKDLPASIGESLITPQDGVFNAASFALPNPLMAKGSIGAVQGATRGAKLLNAAKLGGRNVAAATAENLGYSITQPLLERGDLRKDEVVTGTVGGLPLTLAGQALGTKDLLKNSLKKTKKDPVGTVSVEPVASNTDAIIDGWDDKPISNESSIPTNKVASDLDATNRILVLKGDGLVVHDPDIIKLAQDPKTKDSIEQSLKLKYDAEIADRDAGIAHDNVFINSYEKALQEATEKTAKLQRASPGSVFTVSDILATTKQDATKQTLTKKQTEDNARVVNKAKSIDAIPSTISDADIAKLTDSQLKSAINASILLKNSGESTDGFLDFPNFYEAKSFREKARAKVGTPDPNAKTDAEVQSENASKKNVQNANDALDLKGDIPDEQFFTDARVKVIASGLMDDDGSVLSQLSKMGYSTPDLNKLILLSRNSDPDAKRVFRGILQGRPLDIASELDAFDTRLNNQKVNNQTDIANTFIEGERLDKARGNAESESLKNQGKAMRSEQAIRENLNGFDPSNKEFPIAEGVHLTKKPAKVAIEIAEVVNRDKTFGDAATYDSFVRAIGGKALADKILAAVDKYTDPDNREARVKELLDESNKDLSNTINKQGKQLNSVTKDESIEGNSGVELENFHAQMNAYMRHMTSADPKRVKEASQGFARLIATSPDLARIFGVDDDIVASIRAGGPTSLMDMEDVAKTIRANPKKFTDAWKKAKGSWSGKVPPQ
jgi:hypothetical protein